MFYANYLKLCNSIDKSPSTVAEEIGFQRSTVTRWKNGKSQTDANIQKVADYFHVSVDYLKGTEKTPTVPESDERSHDALDAELKEIWETADQEERAALLAMAKMLKARRNK